MTHQAVAFAADPTKLRPPHPGARPGRVSPPQASRPQDAALERLTLFARWDGEITALWEKVDIASDWGAFELEAINPVMRRRDDPRTIACTFVFHGSASDRTHAEDVLRNALSRIAEWSASSVSMRAPSK